MQRLRAGAPPIGGGVQCQAGCSPVIGGAAIGWQVITVTQAGTLAFTCPQPADTANATVTIKLGETNAYLPCGNSSYDVAACDYVFLFSASGTSFALDYEFTPAN